MPPTTDPTAATADRDEADRDQDDRDEDDRDMIRLQSGDHGGFEALVARHQGPLFGFFLKNTRNRAHAEDLTQDTLLKVFSQNWDYIPLGRFRGWLYRIGRNLMIDAARRQNRDALVKAVRADPEGGDVLDRVAGGVERPDVLTDRALFAELVNELLDEIPAEQRETFTLHHHAGVPLPEVALAMDTNLSTAKSRLRLAREKLRAKLAQRGIFDPNGPDSC